MPAAGEITDPVMVAELAGRLPNLPEVLKDREEILRSSMTSFPNAPLWANPQSSVFCVSTAWEWFLKELETRNARRGRLSSPTPGSSELPSADFEDSDACCTGMGGEVTPLLFMNRGYDPVDFLLGEVNLRLERIKLLQVIYNSVIANANANANAVTVNDPGTDTQAGTTDTEFPYDGSIFVHLSVTTHVFTSDDDFHQLHLHMEELNDFAIEQGLATDASHEAEVLRTRVPGLTVSRIHATVTLFERVALRILQLEKWIHDNTSAEGDNPPEMLNFSPLNDARLQVLGDAGFLFLPSLIRTYQATNPGGRRVNVNAGPRDREPILGDTLWACIAGTGDNGTGDNGTGDNDIRANASISARIADVCFVLRCSSEKLDTLNLHMERVYRWAVEAGFATDTSSVAVSLRTEAVGHVMFGDFADWETRGHNNWTPWSAFVRLFDRLVVQIIGLENYINPHTTTEILYINSRLESGLRLTLDPEIIHALYYYGSKFLPNFIMFCQGAGRLTASAESSDTEREDHRANLASILLAPVRAT